MREFIIGDIHGCLQELDDLLTDLRPDSGDHLIFLGDYVDRGPNSFEVINRLIELKRQYQTTFLMGNHEELLISYLEAPTDLSSAAIFILNGGVDTLASYSSVSGELDIPISHRLFFHELKLYAETKTFFCVHAGVPEVTLKEIRMRPHFFKKDLLWMREPFLSSDYKWEKIIVHGHTPTNTVDIRPNRIGIDTGCVYGGGLTGFNTREQTFTVVPHRTFPVISPQNFKKDQRISERFEGKVPLRLFFDKGSYCYETINFNEYGFLVRCVDGTSPKLRMDQRVMGVVSENTEAEVMFKGQIVRVIGNHSNPNYGIQLSTWYAHGDRVRWNPRLRVG